MSKPNIPLNTKKYEIPPQVKRINTSATRSFSQALQTGNSNILTQYFDNILYAVNKTVTGTILPNTQLHNFERILNNLCEPNVTFIGSYQNTQLAKFVGKVLYEQLITNYSIKPCWCNIVTSFNNDLKDKPELFNRYSTLFITGVYPDSSKNKIELLQDIIELHGDKAIYILTTITDSDNYSLYDFANKKLKVQPDYGFFLTQPSNIII